MSQLMVRKATKKDLDAIKELADSHRSELGFVLRPALARSISREEVLIAENSAGVIGFVEYHHREDEQTTLYHIAVRPTHRRKGVGQALVHALRSEAESLGKRRILLKCPTDLPANGFYDRLGFQSVRKEQGKARNLDVWMLFLSA